MEVSPNSPYYIAAIGGILALLAYRGILRKQVRTFSGLQTSSQAGYYLVITGFFLGAVIATVIAAMQFHMTRGWIGVTLYLLSVIALGYVIHQFRQLSRGLLIGTRRLFNRRAKPPGPSPKTWAIATAAILSRVKGWNDYMLGGMEPSERRAKAARRKLRREWEIDDGEEFDEVQEWLLDVGHRAEFKELVEKIGGMRTEELENYISEVIPAMKSRTEREEELHRVEMIRDNIGGVRHISFLAWDILRYIDNYRMGYLAEYVDEEEAWSQILSASQVLQTRFDSWKELGESFLLAREFWSVVETRKNGKVYQKTFERLLEDGKSPWSKIPWDLPLYARE